MQDDNQVTILLGSNIEPEKNLVLAIEMLQKQITILRISQVYETHLMGADGLCFLNTALVGLTPLSAYSLKKKILHPLETDMGCTRSRGKYSPRPIDFDIIAFNGKLLDDSIWKVAYLAVPVAELLPYYLSATGESLNDVAVRLKATTQLRERQDVYIDCVCKCH